ncbi:PREDICTED: uncharacterized protein LOC105451760 [Wasmannia auropunctata]|uniref:uncharacterized protein LOC105451760 n=1 Tax=Wasmannia auropunctata TaxID=64793 RepID=UPI0005EDA08D|nr:PREDICTED: uncharacterized protein LOC105451760 [Wasmannia auropunctata]
MKDRASHRGKQQERSEGGGSRKALGDNNYGVSAVYSPASLVLASIESDNYNTAAGAAVRRTTTMTTATRSGVAAGVRISISCSLANFGYSRCQQFPPTTNTISSNKAENETNKIISYARSFVKGSLRKLKGAFDSN